MERRFKPVKYQKGVPGTVWKIKKITFEPVFYEKALDLRRNFMYSVSWFIACAIDNFLDELVEEMLNPEDPEIIEDMNEIPYILPDCWVMYRYLSQCWGFRRKNTWKDSYFNPTNPKPPATHHRDHLPEIQARPKSASVHILR